MFSACDGQRNIQAYLTEIPHTTATFSLMFYNIYEINAQTKPVLHGA